MKAKQTKGGKALLTKAHDFAKKAHDHQKRSSGEPFFIHLEGVVELLTQIGADDEMLAAAYLHDTIEDTEVTSRQLQKEFGSNITKMVESVTKVQQLEGKLDKKERSMLSVRKMFRAMGKDIRVLFIKLADRLHNMRTLDSLTNEQRMRIAVETEQIYCPLANLLGLRSWYLELRDLCLHALHPGMYDLLKRKSAHARHAQLDGLSRWTQRLEEFLKEMGWKNTHVTLRERGLWNVHEHYEQESTPLQNVETFFTVHIVIPDKESCYDCMGIVHHFSTPVSGHVKDYIAVPKVNGYQALHTTILTTRGNPIEIVISTNTMEQEAEHGTSYLSPEKTQNPVWMDTLLSLESNEKDLRAFFRMIQSDIFGEQYRIHVTSPRSCDVDVPAHASLLDVAFYAGADIGAHATHVKINNKTVSLKQKVQGGEPVSFTVDKQHHPRTAEDHYYIYTSIGQKKLVEELSALPEATIIKRGTELLNRALMVSMDPFFSIQWRKQIRQSLRTQPMVLAQIGSGLLDPFLYLSERSQVEEHFLLSPDCFSVTSSFARPSNTYFVLRAPIASLRQDNVVGLQIAPDVIEVYDKRDVREMKIQLSREIIPLSVKKEKAEHPFVFALRWNHESHVNPLEIISSLQSMIDTSVELLQFKESSVTLGFRADKLRTMHVAYSFLYSHPAISHILRITPHAYT